MKARDSGVSAAKRAPNPKGKYYNALLRPAVFASEREKGNVLVASITVVLAVSVTGAAMMQSSVRKHVGAGYIQSEQQVRQMAESCVENSASYLRGLSSAPSNDVLPVQTEMTIGELTVEGDNERHIAKLNGYSMNCSLGGSPAGGGAVVQSEVNKYSEGEMVQDTGGYGLSGDLSPKIYYWLSAEGNGPDNAQKDINAVISAQY